MKAAVNKYKKEPQMVVTSIRIPKELFEEAKMLELKISQICRDAIKRTVLAVRK